MIQYFVLEWLKVVAYCNRPDFDRDIFEIYHDNYRKSWAQLSSSDQGEISYKLAQTLEKQDA